MLAAHWQAAGMAQQRPVRMREMIQVRGTAIMSLLGSVLLKMI